MRDVLIVMNNYFHDVATALLLSSAVILGVLERRARERDSAAVDFLKSTYSTLTRFAQGALAWIIIGGIPRTIFFWTHEFMPAQAKSQLMVYALMVKHTLMAVAVVAGLVLWSRVRRILKDEPAATKAAA